MPTLPNQPTGPKLYRVVIEHEVWVVAADARTAENEAARAMRYEDDFAPYAVEVTSSTHCAPDERQYIPYGQKDKDDPDRTVAGWRDLLGTAWVPTEEEAKMIAKLRKMNGYAP